MKNIFLFDNEICGDEKLSMKERLNYLYQNMIKNFSLKPTKITVKNFIVKNFLLEDAASPSRFLLKQFIVQELPKLLIKKKLIF